ncbi:9621_t:CDS:2 [Ambispora leptoticha]|uniref:9621_t:CDS:1 n=1 Tax=Ambispora leptoticha TaxID=144679 RepID=A0A9N9FFN5_9GLOM|nr:9621_t:CDS:2 [Ambispora leptoticha]
MANSDYIPEQVELRFNTINLDTSLRVDKGTDTPASDNTDDASAQMCRLTPNSNKSNINIDPYSDEYQPIHTGPKSLDDTKTEKFVVRKDKELGKEASTYHFF